MHPHEYKSDFCGSYVSHSNPIFSSSFFSRTLWALGSNKNIDILFKAHDHYPSIVKETIKILYLLFYVTIKQSFLLPSVLTFFQKLAYRQ